MDDDQDGRTDCADLDCRHGCSERCDDGVDNDGDGRADCADPACLRMAHCSELDCADGADDDADGLIDCEDGDCFVACQEDCFDRVDNDGDALSDCADDDCAGMPPCDGAVEVLGGQLRAVRQDETRLDGMYHTSEIRWDLQLRSVFGVVRLGGSAPETCTWSFDAGHFGFTHAGRYPAADYDQLQPVLRRGFRLQPDCAAFTDSAFLPRRLMMDRSAARQSWTAHRVGATYAPEPWDTAFPLGRTYVPFRPWYAGPPVTLARSSTTHVYSPGLVALETTWAVLEPITAP